MDIGEKISKIIKKYITIRIEIKDNNQFLPGDYVRGGIYINIEGIDPEILKNYPNFRIKFLEIQMNIKSQEHIKQYKLKGKKTKCNCIDEHITCNQQFFFSQKLGLRKGEILQPFIIKLNQELPPTIKVKTSNNTYFEHVWNIEVTLNMYYDILDVDPQDEPKKTIVKTVRKQSSDEKLQTNDTINQSLNLQQQQQLSQQQQLIQRLSQSLQQHIQQQKKQGITDQIGQKKQKQSSDTLENQIESEENGQGNEQKKKNEKQLSRSISSDNLQQIRKKSLIIEQENEIFQFNLFSFQNEEQDEKEEKQNRQKVQQGQTHRKNQYSLSNLNKYQNKRISLLIDEENQFQYNNHQRSRSISKLLDINYNNLRKSVDDMPAQIESPTFKRKFQPKKQIEGFDLKASDELAQPNLNKENLIKEEEEENEEENIREDNGSMISSNHMSTFSATPTTNFAHTTQFKKAQLQSLKIPILVLSRNQFYSIRPIEEISIFQFYKMFKTFYQGEIQLESQLNQNVYYNGETIKLQLKIDSQKMLRNDIHKNVQVQLIMILQYKNNPKRYREEIILNSLDKISIKVGEIQLQELDIKIPNNKNLQNFIASTYEGDVIQINYYVRIQILNQSPEISNFLNNFCFYLYNNTCQVVQEQLIMVKIFSFAEDKKLDQSELYPICKNGKRYDKPSQYPFLLNLTVFEMKQLQSDAFGIIQEERESLYEKFRSIQHKKIQNSKFGKHQAQKHKRLYVELEQNEIKEEEAYSQDINQDIDSNLEEHNQFSNKESFILIKSLNTSQELETTSDVNQREQKDKSEEEIPIEKILKDI